MNPLIIILSITVTCFSVSVARDLHVDPSQGNDSNDGSSQSLKTIKRAIRIAQPGDTIHLKPVIYYEYAGFHNKRGEAGKPITLAGHGATLEGSDAIDPSTWQEVSPGLFKNGQLMPTLNRAILWRWFFLFNGKINRMGRVMKGKSDEFKKPESLQEGEWTFVAAGEPSSASGDSQKAPGTFYLKIKSGQNLAEARIRYPVRPAGVIFSGDNAHLVIRNLTASHPYNDGFNIHGDCRDVVFENIRAIECGDDGISAHESAQYRVNGLVSIGNGTGICDTGSSQTSYKNLFIADCVGVDLYFLDTGRYSIDNGIVLSSAQKPLIVTGGSKGSCELKINNLFIRRIGTPQAAVIAINSSLFANKLTLDNLDLKITGKAEFENCLINGHPNPKDAKAPGADLKTLVKTLVPKKYQTQLP
ncbi:MAG: hypothetical protein QM496_16180 [Verrucomicrobiota bacterium]